MDVAGKKVTLVGMGKTSLALSLLLKHLEAEPFVTEHRKREACEDIVCQFEAAEISFECGGHTELGLTEASLVIPSPGVSPSIPFLKQAVEFGIPIMSELEFASRFSKSTLIAITGTNGKTTTTELTAHLLSVCGLDVALAGNNECPFSKVVMQDQQPDFVVLEISSYQLELVDEFRPKVAVVLNVSNDHLARHGSIENYASTKARIFARQAGDDVAIVNLDDSVVNAMAAEAQGQVTGFSVSGNGDVCLDGSDFVVNGSIVAKRDDSGLPGRHNTENILAALAVVSVFDVNWEAVREGLRSFAGVEHRIEKVTNINGAAYYNDSKSTNLDSLKVALESFKGDILLIAGGQGKGGDYSVLAELIESRVKHVIAIGSDTKLICDAWGSRVSTSIAESMMDAVMKAHDRARPGDVVLLSPACASFDMYSNFEERGLDFKRCVRDIAAHEVKA